MYIVEFLENGSVHKAKGDVRFPDFKNIFVLDFFYLPDSFLHCDSVNFKDYYERCDQILKSVKIFP
jgi:hypothetical protein